MKRRTQGMVRSGSRSGRPSPWLVAPLAILIAIAALLGVQRTASQLAAAREAATLAAGVAALAVSVHATETAQTGASPGSELQAGLALAALAPAIENLERVAGDATRQLRFAFDQAVHEAHAGEAAILTGQRDAAQINTSAGAANRAFLAELQRTSRVLNQEMDSVKQTFDIAVAVFVVLLVLAAAGTIALILRQKGITERAAARAATHFLAMTRQSSDVIARLDPNGTVVEQSASLLRLLGRSELAMIGRPFAGIVAEPDRNQLMGLLEAARARPGEPAHGELHLIHGDGSARAFEATAYVAPDQAGTDGIILTCRGRASGAPAATPPAQNGRPLQHPVSGLISEPLFRDRLGHALNRSVRTADPVALLVVELGGEETFAGLTEEAKAATLRLISGRIERLVRNGDTVAHLRGLEFAVILESTDLDAARAISRRIHEQLQIPVAHLNGQVRLAPRIGIAVKTDPRDTVDTLLLDARTALGGATGARPDPVTPAISAGTNLSANDASGSRAAAFLHAGLRAPRRGEQAPFEMRFLPVSALNSGEIVELEAITLSRHPERGLLPVEQSGRLDSANRWMLEQACRLANGLPKTRTGAPVRLGVEIPALTPLDDVLLDTVASAILKSGLQAGSLQLAFAVRSLAGDPAAAVLRELNKLGVRIFVTDVGVEGLPDLGQLPLDGIRLDRAVVAPIDRSTAHRAFVRSLVQWAKPRGMTVVATGVESLDQAEKLSELGVDAAQGPLYFRPIQEAQLAALLTTAPSLSAAD